MVVSSSGCLQGIRQSEWESREFAKVRKLLNEAIVLETPYYDITRVNADEDDDEEAAVQVRSLVHLPLRSGGWTDRDRHSRTFRQVSLTVPYLYTSEDMKCTICAS